MSDDICKIISTTRTIIIDSCGENVRDDHQAFEKAIAQYRDDMEYVEHVDANLYAPVAKLISKEYIDKNFGDDPYFKWTFECRLEEGE